ncbi:MAG: hypothetical protein LH647_18005, partial [Leptolyngbyaceae cyanobacterium CAN_BIN12]|nr:hypothetical protein [Leptolyngbyaceae cyanobacterium CAN_BIN12]
TPASITSKCWNPRPAPINLNGLKLSRQEEAWGLLEDWEKIPARRGWLKCLEDKCAELKWHRVVWRKDADPYRLKLLKSAQRQRISGVAIKENLQTEQSNSDSHSPP